MIFYSGTNKKQAKKSMSAFGRIWNFSERLGTNGQFWEDLGRKING
jgi:hypothetical protein